MQVNGISSQIPSAIQTTMTETVQEVLQDQPQTGEIPEAGIVEDQEKDSEEMKGVIRNLLDGHFKGVADVRLRINFHEELAAIEGEQLKAVAEEKIAGLLDTVGSGIDELPAAPESLSTEAAPEDETPTVAGLHGEFVDTVNELKQEFETTATRSAAEDLIGGVENAFAALVESLQNLLVPVIEEDPPIAEVEPENDPAPQDGENQISEPIAETEAVEEQAGQAPETPVTDTDEPQLPDPVESNYQDIIDQLGDAFSSAIAELREALNSAQIIPPLSEPSGNGKAYEKFLAIYQNL